MNHLQNILKIGGSLGSFVLANSLDPTGCTGEIIKAIAGNLASNFVANYSPEELLKYLESPNPELNHDIEKLMLDSVMKAVELVTIKYYQENPYDDKFVKKTLKRLIEDAKIMSANADNELLSTNKDAWIEGIDEYIFRGRENEDGKLNEIADFFKKHLKSCYELVFNEGLKDDKNEKPLKAFLIKALNGLVEQTDKNSEIQQKILDEIKQLKDNKTTVSLSIAQSYFEAEFDKIDKKLVQLLEIAKKTEGKIDLILQFFGIFEQKIDKLQEGQTKIIDILENQAPKIPHHLTRPPSIPEVFVGRETELKNIYQQLFESENFLLLVNGEGGIGKTSLAAKYYHQYATAYTHLAWVLCEQSIAEALLLLAMPLALQFEDTATTEQRLEILLTKMANLDKPCLLIIDNANEVADLQQNYENLRRCPNFHVLLTSRINDYRRAKFFKIDSLPREQALAVFREHYPKLQTHEEPIFEGIYDAIGGNTLVLELLAKNLYSQNTLKTKYTLPNLLADLQTKGLLQIVEDDAVAVEYQSYRTAKPTEIIAAMYDLSKLSEAESCLLSVFAILPAESIAFDTIEQLLPNTPNLDKTLLSLAQKGWLSHNTTDSSFKCSPVIQEITTAKNQNLYADCEELIYSLVEKIGDNKETTSISETILYTRYLECITSFFKLSSLNLALTNSFLFLGDLTKDTGEYEKSLGYYEKSTILSEEHFLIHPNQVSFKNSLAISYSKLGILQKDLGNLDKASVYFNKSNQLYEELCRGYPNQIDFKHGLAISFKYLGDLQRIFDYLYKALEYYEKSNQIFESLCREYPYRTSFKNGLAISYSILGDLQNDLCKLDKALVYYEKDCQLSEELFRDYPNEVSFKSNLAVSYERLGRMQISLSNTDKALEYFKKSSKLSEELYQDYPNLIEISFCLANSYLHLGYLQVEYLWLGTKMIPHDIGGKAEINYKKALPILEDLCQKVPIPKYQEQLNWVKKALSILQRPYGYIEMN